MFYPWSQTFKKSEVWGGNIGIEKPFISFSQLLLIFSSCYLWIEFSDLLFLNIFMHFQLLAFFFLYKIKFLLYHNLSVYVCETPS